jgi:hypothetical protein
MGVLEHVHDKQKNVSEFVQHILPHRHFIHIYTVSSAMLLSELL